MTLLNQREVLDGKSQRELELKLEEEKSTRSRVLRVKKEGMFNEAWVWLALLFVAAGVLSREIGFMALAACLITVIPISWLWNHWSLRNLDYRRRFDRQRVFPGEVIQMTLEITNRKFLPLSWVRFQDEFPLTIIPKDMPLAPTGSSETTGYMRSAFSVRWYERVKRTYQLHCQQRGHYFLGPITAKSGDIFTLFTSEEERLLRDPIIVYPQIFPLHELGFPTHAPFGEVRSRRSLVQDPTRTRGIRDYRPEDGFRHIHWKASARRNQLQTRVYEPTTDMSLVVALNVLTTPKAWLGFIPDLLERSISVAASIANHAAEQRWSLGLLSNGVPRSDQPIKVMPGRSPDQLSHVLEALAGITSFASTSIEAMLRSQSPNLPLGATLVVVTSIISDELWATLLQLKEAGRRLVLVSLATEPPDDDFGITTYHLPPIKPSFRRDFKKPTTAGGTLQSIPVPKPVRPSRGENS